MKKIIYLSFFVLVVLNVKAQTANEETPKVKSNHWFASGLGTYEYTNNKSDGSKNYDFRTVLSLGKFVSNHVMLGGLSGYGTSLAKNSKDSTTSDISVLTAGGFIRYFYTPGKQYSFFNEFAAAYAQGKNNQTNEKISGLGGGASLGFVYWTSSHFALQATYTGIVYSTISFDNFKNQASEKFQFGGDLTALKIGAVIKL